MQTFSYMRRNSSDYKILTTLFYFVVAIFYALVSSFYLLATPLIGLSFYYIITHIDNPKSYYKIALIMIFSLVMEINRGLIPFSFIALVFILNYLSIRSFLHFIYSKNLLLLIYITIGYISYYLLNLFLSFIFDLPLPHFGMEYIYYILSDLVIAAVML